MTAPDPHPLNRSLRVAHRTVLGTLALCAVIIALQESPEEPPPDRVLTVVAVSLGLATVITRRLGTSSRMRASQRVALTLASYACAAALGILAVGLAVVLEARQTGLVYVAAAAILCLAPPPRLTLGSV